MFAATPAATAPPRVVINEIMYHPPDDLDDLQWIEIVNASRVVVDVSKWSFQKGVKLEFNGGTKLEPGIHAIVCRDMTAFRRRYGPGPRVLGVFQGRLSHSGEAVELRDGSGQLVDRVAYQDSAPWPSGPDGYSPSLERIYAAGPSEDPANWQASSMPRTIVTEGSPGRTNSCWSAVPLPRIAEVKIGAVAPSRPVAVQARVEDSSGVDRVRLFWAASAGARITNWAEVALERAVGGASNGMYQGIIPSQPEGRVVRFTIRAVAKSGAERMSPGDNEPRPTHSYSTFINTNQARVGFVQVLTLGGIERPPAPKYGRAPPNAPAPAPRGTAALLYFPPGKQEVVLRDHVRARSRTAGLKIQFHRDEPLLEMTGINLVFEPSPRHLLAEHLAYELYRKAGVAAPLSEPVRLWVDGRLAGYHLLIEQPNQSFLRRIGRSAEGNLYKLLWYEQGIVGQHEKKTNPRDGHQDIVAVIEQVRRLQGDAQWAFIQRQFKVEEMASYYAASMCIQNWDGFFNNYYAFHEPGPTGRWEVFPWDQDKTWGDYDGASPKYDWYSMPLTLGMDGDRQTGNGNFGWGMWWRPPGFFSGPLLASSQFRGVFLKRLRELCADAFTPERMGPIINSLQHQLREEVAVRSLARGENPAAALRDFSNHIESFRNQVIHRRQFILKELGGK